MAKGRLPQPGPFSSLSEAKKYISDLKKKVDSGYKLTNGDTRTILSVSANPSIFNRRSDLDNFGKDVRDILNRGASAASNDVIVASSETLTRNEIRRKDGGPTRTQILSELIYDNRNKMSEWSGSDVKYNVFRDQKRVASQDSSNKARDLRLGNIVGVDGASAGTTGVADFANRESRPKDSDNRSLSDRYKDRSGPMRVTPVNYRTLELNKTPDRVGGAPKTGESSKSPSAAKSTSDENVSLRQVRDELGVPLNQGDNPLSGLLDAVSSGARKAYDWASENIGSINSGAQPGGVTANVARSGSIGRGVSNAVRNWTGLLGATVGPPSGQSDSALPNSPFINRDSGQSSSQPQTQAPTGSSPRSSQPPGGARRVSAPAATKPNVSPSATAPTQGILDRFADAMAYDKWATGPNDSPLRNINVSPFTRGAANDPSRSGRMAGALASRIPQPTQPSAGAGTGGSGVDLSGALSSANVRRMGSNLFDAASSVFSAMQAGRTRIPSYEAPQSYRDYQSRLTAASNVGLTSAEQSSMQNMIDRNVATGLDSISRFAGASGSSGAALGAIGRVATGANNAMATMSMQDQSLANQNLARLGQFEVNNRNFDFNQVFTPFRDQQVSDRNQLLAASLMNRRQISDRNDYYRTYEDPNSPYQRMEQAKLGTQNAISRSIGNLENAPINFSQEAGMISTFDDTKLDVERSKTRSQTLAELALGVAFNTPRRNQRKSVSSFPR